MLDKVRMPTADRVALVVAEVLNKYGVDGPVFPEAELARYGLTSIDMVELMLGVEAEFDATIPPAEITLANFGTISSIAAMVTRLHLEG